MQQTFFYLWFLSFVFWFPPFFVFSLFLFPVWETENNEVWSFSLFPIYIRPWVRRDSLALKKEPLASLWIDDCQNQEKESAS